jgi:hypothetical protein
MVQLRRSVEKIERMTYEMSLSHATGRKMYTEIIPLEQIIPVPPSGGAEIKDPNAV